MAWKKYKWLIQATANNIKQKPKMYFGLER